MKDTAFSFVFPTYNERENVRILIPGVFDIFKGFEIEVIIVDDGSADGTREEVERLQKTYPGIFLLKRDKLEGIGSALIAGYDMAKGKYIISCDSDLSFPLEDVKKIAEKLLTGNYDLVQGSRYIRGALYEAPDFKIFEKKMISKIGNIFLRFATGIPIHDFSVNCRGMKRDSWKRLSLQSKNNFMLFEMIWRSNKMGFAMTEVPVRFYNRKFGVSKLSLEKETLKFFLQFMKLK